MFALLDAYNRFDYLTKSVSRNGTITKRKVANSDLNGAPRYEASSITPLKFGTFTKKSLQGLVCSPDPTLNNSGFGGPVNRTFDISQNSPSFHKNRTYEIDGNTDSDVEYLGEVNTNTITKSVRNRRSFTVAQLNSTFASNESNLSGSESSVANDTNHNQSSVMSRTYTKDEDEDTESSASNYPTISRTLTQTLLIRRDNSKGNVGISKTSRSNMTKQNTTSSEDLLNSDTSTSSGLSNFSKTSIMSGQSEPNILQKLSNRRATQVINAPQLRQPLASGIGRFQANGKANANSNRQAENFSNGNDSVSSSKLAHTFGSMGSLNGGVKGISGNTATMTRTASQVSILLQLLGSFFFFWIIHECASL